MFLCLQMAKWVLAWAEVGASVLELSRTQGSRQAKGHLSETSLLSMLSAATGMCQALSQMAGSDSSHPQRRGSTVQQKISDILSH